jgi:hypothetical protein
MPAISKFAAVYNNVTPKMKAFPVGRRVVESTPSCVNHFEGPLLFREGAFGLFLQLVEKGEELGFAEGVSGGVSHSLLPFTLQTHWLYAGWDQSSAAHPDQALLLQVVENG